MSKQERGKPAYLLTQVVSKPQRVPEQLHHPRVTEHAVSFGLRCLQCTNITSYAENPCGELSTGDSSILARGRDMATLRVLSSAETDICPAPSWEYEGVVRRASSWLDFKMPATFRHCNCWRRASRSLPNGKRGTMISMTTAP